MQYTKAVTFSSGGSSTNQTSATLKCARGIIHKIEIVFPSGCAGLVNVQIFTGGHPIAPTTFKQTYSGNDEIIEVPEFIELRKDFNVITISGWNEDDTYDHKVRFRIFVLPKEVLLPVGAQEGILAALKSLVLHPVVIKETAEEIS